jgi:hypothetical protein
MLMALRIVPCALGGWRSVSWISSSTCSAYAQQERNVEPCQLSSQMLARKSCAAAPLKL